MSDKQLAVRQSLSASRNGQSISPHDDIDVLVDQLLRRHGQEGGGTVDEILGHPQVKKHGMLGRLSSGQQSLVTSVVSLMQDRVATDARKNADALKQIIIHEREALGHISRSFADTAKHLYQLPLLGRAGRDHATVEHDVATPRSAQGAGAPPMAPPPPVTSLSVWERFLTWGNLLAGTAIVLAVLVVKTSVETASFETQYRLTQENLDQTRAELEKSQGAHQQLVTENQSLAEQNASLTARLEAKTREQANEQKRLATDLQLQAQALADARQTIARQQSQLAQTESSKNVGQSRLHEQISALQQELAALKGKQTQQGENASMWKQLAEERKLEIGKLQNELRTQTGVKQNSAAKEGFLGIF